MKDDVALAWRNLACGLRWGAEEGGGGRPGGGGVRGLAVTAGLSCMQISLLAEFFQWKRRQLACCVNS